MERCNRCRFTVKLNHYPGCGGPQTLARPSADLAHRSAGGSRTGWGAETVERLPQFLGDVLRVAAFDVRPLEHENQLPVAQQGDRRRGGPVPGEVRARPGRRFAVLTGKYRRQDLRPRAVGKRERYGGPGLSRRTAADRIDDDQGRSPGRAQDRIHLLGSSHFPEAQAGQFLSHRLDHFFWIHARPPVSGSRRDPATRSIKHQARRVKQVTSASDSLLTNKFLLQRIIVRQSPHSNSNRWAMVSSVTSWAVTCTLLPRNWPRGLRLGNEHPSPCDVSWGRQTERRAAVEENR